VRGLSRDAKVSEFLGAGTNWWKTNLVRNIFNGEEAQAFYGMAMCPRNRKDQMVWAGTKHGDFTIQSAYHMAKERSLRGVGGCSNTQLLKSLWQGIWNIKGIQVVKMFLWQAYNNILPTKKKNDEE
jgi:hypothetical protein